MTNLYPCPACGYQVFNEPPGSYKICPICFWEDDLSQLRFPKMGGANKVSLIEAQVNFGNIGAVEERLLQHVRKPYAQDKKDEQWRPIDLPLDKIEEPIPGKDYGLTYPEDSTQLYYWRR